MYYKCKKNNDNVGVVVVVGIIGFVVGVILFGVISWLSYVGLFCGFVYLFVFYLGYVLGLIGY